MGGAEFCLPNPQGREPKIDILDVKRYNADFAGLLDKVHTDTDREDKFEIYDMLLSRKFIGVREFYKNSSVSRFEALNNFLQTSGKAKDIRGLCVLHPNMMHEMLDYVYGEEGYLEWLKTKASEIPNSGELQDIIEQNLPRETLDLFDEGKTAQRIWDKLKEKAIAVSKPHAVSPPQEKYLVNIKIVRDPMAKDDHLHICDMELVLISGGEIGQSLIRLKTIGEKVSYYGIDASVRNNERAQKLLRIENGIADGDVSIGEIGLGAIGVNPMTVSQLDGADLTDVYANQLSRAILKGKARDISIVVATSLYHGQKDMDLLIAKLQSGLESELTKYLGNIDISAIRRYVGSDIRGRLRVSLSDPGDFDVKGQYKSDFGPIFVYSEGKIQDSVDFYARMWKSGLPDRVSIDVPVPEVYKGDILGYAKNLETAQIVEVKSSPELEEMAVRNNLREHYLHWQDLLEKYDTDISKILGVDRKKLEGLLGWLGRRSSLETDILVLRPRELGQYGTEMKGYFRDDGRNSWAVTGKNDFARVGYGDLEFDMLQELRVVWETLKTDLKPAQGPEGEDIDREMELFCKGTKDMPAFAAITADRVKQFAKLAEGELATSRVRRYRLTPDTENALRVTHLEWEDRPVGLEATVNLTDGVFRDLSLALVAKKVHGEKIFDHSVDRSDTAQLGILAEFIKRAEMSAYRAFSRPLQDFMKPDREVMVRHTLISPDRRLVEVIPAQDELGINTKWNDDSRKFQPVQAVLDAYVPSGVVYISPETALIEK